MVQNSFGGPGQPELGGLLLNEPRFSYARAYDHTAWPHREILADIAREVAGTVLLGTNSLRFNADNFRLAAMEGRLPLIIDTTAYFSDAAAASDAVNRAGYFMYKDGGEPDQANFNGQGAAAIRMARESGRFVELTTRTLPDGGVIHVFRKKPAGGAFLTAGLDNMPPGCSVKFADELLLTGIGVTQTSTGIEVKYRWKCLKPMNRDYWCFTQVLNRQGKIIGYLDHLILGGDPPTRLWSPGDAAIERREATLPEAAYELRVGVFHRESGDRRPITESSFPLMQERTAVIVPAGAAH
jgi:hypothetical protein